MGEVGTGRHRRGGGNHSAPVKKLDIAAVAIANCKGSCGQRRIANTRIKSINAPMERRWRDCSRGRSIATVARTNSHWLTHLTTPTISVSVVSVAAVGVGIKERQNVMVVMLSTTSDLRHQQCWHSRDGTMYCCAGRYSIRLPCCEMSSFTVRRICEGQGYSRREYSDDVRE